MPRVLKIIARITLYTLFLCFLFALNVVVCFIMGGVDSWQARLTLMIVDFLPIEFALLWSLRRAMNEEEKNERLIREYIEKNLP